MTMVLKQHLHQQQHDIYHNDNNDNIYNNNKKASTFDLDNRINKIPTPVRVSRRRAPFHRRRSSQITADAASENNVNGVIISSDQAYIDIAAASLLDDPSHYPIPSMRQHQQQQQQQHRATVLPLSSQCTLTSTRVKVAATPATSSSLSNHDSSSTPRSLCVKYCHTLFYNSEPVWQLETMDYCNGHEVWGMSSYCLLTSHGYLRLRLNYKGRNARGGGWNVRETREFCILDIIYKSGWRRRNEMMM